MIKPVYSLCQQILSHGINVQKLKNYIVKEHNSSYTFLTQLYYYLNSNET